MKWLIIFIISTNSSFAGIGDFWFKKSGISCETNSVEFNKNLIGSNQQLVTCFSSQSISSSQISEFENDTNQLRQDLELWIYIQNSAKKIKLESEKRIHEYQEYRKDLENKLSNPFTQTLKKNYKLLSKLYENKRKLDKQDSLCSRIKVWNVFERFTSTVDCNYVRSKQFDIDTGATQKAIDNLESVSPIFLHPIFQNDLKNDDLTSSFDYTFSNFLSSAIPELENKKSKYQNLTNTTLNKKTLTKVLENPKSLREITAINYNPQTKLIKPYNENYKTISLNKANCIVHQKLYAQNIDETLSGFGKDVALLVAPFAIKGKINAIFKSIKGAQKLSKMNNAKKALIAAEGAYIATEFKGLKEVENKCQSINIEISQHLALPDKLKRQATECKELMDSMATSYALAVLGGSAAVKLSKFDIADIRLARIAKKGKEKLQTSVSTIQATIIKNANIITEQLDSLAPEPTMATAITNNISTSLKPESSQNIHFNQSTSSSSYTDGRKKTSILQRRRNRKKQRAQNNQEANPSAASQEVIDLNISQRVERAIKKLDCYVDSSCKNELLEISPGLNSLANGPKGLHITEKVFDLLKGFKNIPPMYYEFLKDCLKITKGMTKCSSHQIDSLLTLIDHKFKTPINEHFIKRILHITKLDASDSILTDSLTFLSEFEKKSDGKLVGPLNKVSKEGNFLNINGELYPISDVRASNKAISYLRENEALNLLKRLGFKVNSLPENESERVFTGVQKLFKKLATKEKISPKRNPDVILDDKYIADIYSPLNGISENNLTTIVQGILSKTEGRNFVRHSDSGQSYGKRQTNRVVVYTDEIHGDINRISAMIREMIGTQRPEHIQEAFILTEINGVPTRVSVWP